MPPPRRHAEAELYRVALAKFDFKSASVAADHLRGNAGDLLLALGGGFPTTDLYWALWTAVAVSYARPFTDSRVGRLSKRRFERFDDSRLDACHRFLLQIRKMLFVHNDLTRIRTVKVFPPGAWGESPGSAQVERASFAESLTSDTLELCELQRARAQERIVELVSDLYGGQAWDEGAI